MVSGTEGFSGESAIPCCKVKTSLSWRANAGSSFQRVDLFSGISIYIDIDHTLILYIQCVYIYMLYIIYIIYINIYIYIFKYIYIYNSHTYIESTHRHAPEESSEIPSAKLRRRDIFGRCSGRSGEETRAANLAKCSALAPWILEHGERICR